MWEKNETVPRSGDYLPPMQIVSHIRINLPHIVIHLSPFSLNALILVTLSILGGLFLSLCKILIPSNIKIVVVSVCVFSVMQRLLSSYSPALASFMSSQTQGACFIPLWSFSLKFETFSLTSFCFSRGFCWFLGYWGGFVVES